MNNNKVGTYINGKEQALEILKLLTPNERNRILSTINLKNPSLAKELKQNSISSRDLEEYSMDYFLNLFTRIKPEILGIALKETSLSFQKAVLKTAPREYAEKAFKALMMNIPPSKNETIVRAKSLVSKELSQITQ